MIESSLTKSLKSPMKSNPIGIFDSGLGGLTVVRQLSQLLPHEKMVYFGDTANLPYGDKSQHFLLERSLEICSFLIQKGAKLIVVACHTASTNVLEALPNHFATPILFITKPAIQEVKRAQKKRIAILATAATIHSGVYQMQLQKELPDAEIFSLACPQFVPAIEEAGVSKPMLRLIVHKTLRELKSKKIEMALLGSTHYPLIQDLIQQELGDDVILIDPAAALADSVYRFLHERNLLNEENEVGNIQFFASKEAAKFQSAAEKFLSNQQILH